MAVTWSGKASELKRSTYWSESSQNFTLNCSLVSLDINQTVSGNWPVIKIINRENNLI